MFHVDPASLATARPAPAGPRALIEAQMAMLTRLAEIGMAIAEAAGRAAVAAGAPGPAAEGAPAPARLADPGLTYTRVARAVRLTLALQARLAEDLVRADRREASTQVDRRRRLHAVVERALEADHGEVDDEKFHQLLGYARERLTESEEDAELDGLPFAEAVARICPDLELSPLWTARMVAAAGGYPNPSSSGEAQRRPEDPASATEPLAFIDGGAAGSSGLRACGAPPEDDGEDEEDTFLEWPPPG